MHSRKYAVFDGCLINIKCCFHNQVKFKPINQNQNDVLTGVSNFDEIRYPANPSLEEEMIRLFHNHQAKHLIKRELINPVDSNDSISFVDENYYSSVNTSCSSNSLDTCAADSRNYNNKKKYHKFKKNLEMCNFCRKNGETEFIYNSHGLYDEFGNTICPILRKYKCPNCNDTGHTIKYCKKTKINLKEKIISINNDHVFINSINQTDVNSFKRMKNSSGRKQTITH